MHRKRNQPHNNHRRRKRPDGHFKPSSSHVSPTYFLPSASALQEYEYASEGSVERILALAQAEQEHRHDWEAAYFKAQVASQRLGQAFGFFITLFLIVSVWSLATTHHDNAAIALAAAGFLCLSLSGIVSFRRRRLYSRTNKRSFSPQSQRHHQRDQAPREHNHDRENQDREQPDTNGHSHQNQHRGDRNRNRNPHGNRRRHHHHRDDRNKEHTRPTTLHEDNDGGGEQQAPAA